MEQTEKSTVQIVSLPEAKQLVDSYILDVIETRMGEALKVHSRYEKLWAEIKASYVAGGKRLRPYMMLISYQAYSSQPVSDVVPIAAALELLHQAMLIHDDIIDRDTVRHHAKNISGSYLDSYASDITAEDERRHFADSSALLAGDLLISEAYYQLSLSNVPVEYRQSAQAIMQQAIFRVIGGELLDTEASFLKKESIDPLSIAEQKTASYSFVAPLSMGATIGGASAEQLAILKHFAVAVGTGFQLRDDLIGLFGDPTVTGKSTVGDLREGKRTVIIDEFLKRTDDQGRALFDEVFGNPDATSQAFASLKQTIIDSGTKGTIESYIEHYAKEAGEQLERLEISPASRTALHELIVLSTQRAL